MPITGLTNGSQPVLGYNYGAREYGRVREGIRFSVQVTMAYSVVIWLVTLAIPELLIRLFNDDPALIAALLVSPYYTESAITQSARLIPVVKAMRLQDRREENRYIQPTHLSFMTFPNTILVPLSPHPDDQMAPNSREEDQQEEANKNQREEERQGHPQHRKP